MMISCSIPIPENENFIVLYGRIIIFLCAYEPHFICSSIVGFHSLAIVNSAVVNIGM
jgi:hypothetical protein